ncbi:homeobox protein SIX3b, partial [Tachysurus ichikawai]
LQQHALAQSALRSVSGPGCAQRASASPSSASVCSGERPDPGTVLSVTDSDSDFDV